MRDNFRAFILKLNGVSWQDQYLHQRADKFTNLIIFCCVLAFSVFPVNIMSHNYCQMGRFVACSLAIGYYNTRFCEVCYI